MASFDPYRKWLGIPPEDQPPHHYRLLGIGLFESDLDVIANAADRQMAHVRSFQSGKYAALSQKLLNELSSARLCLLDPQKRAAYDASLQAQLASIPAAAAPPSAPPAAPPSAPPPSPGPPLQGPPQAAAVAPVAVGTIGRVSPAARSYPARRRNNNWQLPAVAFGVLAAVVLGVALMLAMGDADSPDPARANPGGSQFPVDSFELPDISRTAPPRRPDRVRPRPAPDASPPATDPRPVSTPPDRPAPGPLRLGEMAAFRGHSGPVLGAALAPDGVFIVTGGRDRTVRLWDTVGGYELRQFPGVEEGVFGVSFSRDGNTVYALTSPRRGPGGSSIRSWEAGIGGTPKSLAVAEGQRAISLALAPDGNHAAVGCDDGTIRLVDLATEKEVRAFSGHEGGVNSVAFSLDGNAILSGGEDGVVLAFNRNTGTEVRRFTGHQGAIRAVAVAADGTLAVSGGDDRLVCLWDLRGNRQQAELRGHEQAVTGLAFSPTGDRAVSVGFDGKLIVWNVRDLREGRRFDVPGGPILAVALGADGDRAVTASQDGIVRLWGLVAPAGDEAAPDPLAGQPETADPRTPVPSDDDVQTWTRHIRNDLFQAEFLAAQQPREKAALAEQLFERAREPQSAADAAYAFLDLALQLAVEAGSADLALDVIDALAERYDVDGLAMKVPHLRTIAAETRNVQARGEVVRRVLDTVDEAGRHDQFELAEELLELARSVGGSAHAQAVDGARERVEAMRSAMDAADAARQTLEQQPDDPQAALALGKYECFVKGNWQAGLPLLARGADARLAELAKTELADPGEPHNQIALADAWWELAEGESGEAQARMRRHAVAWYTQAEPNLEGALRDQVQGRILAVDGPAAAAAAREPLPHVPDLAACRNPKTRDALLRHYGGDAETEAAVGRALEWLVRHQSLPDGYWSFNHQGPGNRNPSPNPGTLDKAPNAATGLALLALMGAGHSPRRGDYRRNVAAGVNFLRSRMVPVGPDAGTLFEPQAGQMPSHAMATCALCEAVAMTSDAQSVRAAQAAVNFIANTQNADGGWAYTPRLPDQRAEASSLAATAWNVKALKAAQWAGLKVPDARLTAAEGFFNTVRIADSDGFAPAPRDSQADPVSTAAAMLSLMYLGWQADRPDVIRFAAAAGEKGPSLSGQLYQNLCTAQVLREFGGQPWAAFSAAMRQHLLDTQADQGPEAGSWHFDSSGWNNRSGGRLFNTALAALILETYYRHPPLAQ